MNEAVGNARLSSSSGALSSINRIECGPRMSRVVVFNGIVYLAGITADVSADDIAVQTESVLRILDRRLADAGTTKQNLLSAQIWLKDISRDFERMNHAWEAWVAPGCTPARATCEAKLARTELLIEIVAVAAV